MNPAGYTLSAADIARLGRAVQFVERFSREHHNLTPGTPGYRGTRGDEVLAWPVVCTGSPRTYPDSLIGLSPGLMYFPDPAEDPPWRAVDVWLMPLPDRSLTVGDSGLGRCVGYRDPIGDFEYRPVYALPGVGDSYKPTAPAETTNCVTWYTGYLHLGATARALSVGQSIAPGQQIGYIGYHPSGAHLHFSLGDGDPLFSDDGFPLLGQTADIEAWVTALGVSVGGTHAGEMPDRDANFTSPQLDFIESRFSLPVDPEGGFVANVSSPFHSGYEYFAIDFAFSFGEVSEDAIGVPVFAAFQGDDIKTDVTWVGQIPGAGWGVVLRHQQLGCAPPEPEEPKEDEYDQLATRYSVCINGVRYLTQGRQTIKLVDGTPRVQWRGLFTTRDGCCNCEEGQYPDPVPVPCCPDGVKDELAIALSGPFGPDPDEIVTLTGTATAGDGSWSGDMVGTTEDETEITAVGKVYCSRDTWWFAVTVTLDDGELIGLIIELETDPEDAALLVGTQGVADQIPSESPTVAAVVDLPCTTPPLTPGASCAEATAIVGLTYTDTIRENASDWYYMELPPGTTNIAITVTWADAIGESATLHTYKDAGVGGFCTSPVVGPPNSIYNHIDYSECQETDATGMSRLYFWLEAFAGGGTYTVTVTTGTCP